MDTNVQILENAPERSGISRLLRFVPTWKGNLFVFGLLIIIILAYFYWQVQQVHRTFLSHVRQNSKMLAGVIKLNADSSVLSQEVVEEIMQTFLGNTARFVDHLDDVEPFSTDELAAFATEAGLAGIRIVREDKDTEGPLGWFPVDEVTCETENRFVRHLAADRLYYLTWPRAKGQGCIIVGIASARIEKLQEQIGLPYLLKTLSGLVGIQYVRIEPEGHGAEKALSQPEMTLIDTSDNKVAETRLSLGKDRLVVGLRARYYFARVKQLWYEFVIFSAILAFFGVFFSWLLYRFQAAYLKDVRSFERRLARQREDAVLGRAAASITHEIGNPLNAISMGLQRLQIETDDLSGEHRHLVSSMLKAVQRTKGIITNIRRYARPLTPGRQSIQPDVLVGNILTLYKQQCEVQGIDVAFEAESGNTIIGDPDMLEEVVENLIKNAIEAQTTGGYIRIKMERRGSEVMLAVENGGFSLSEAEPERILEPYFTTKTRGTGLGLTIAGRIVDAHKGRLTVGVPATGVLCITVYLPLPRVS
ncbi:ATP-binding protein [Thermodesulfobacteriota bacterium]